MFETNSLDRVREFDVDTQVIGIQFEFVAVGQRFIFLYVHRETGDRAIDV